MKTFLRVFAFLILVVNASAFSSGGKTWPDAWNISGEWNHTRNGPSAGAGLAGSSVWNLSGAAVEVSPGVWKYRVTFNVTYRQQKRKNTSTSIPNSYVFARKAYVNVHYSFLPIPSTDQQTWAASGVVMASLSQIAYWDPVPTDGLYTVTGNIDSGDATPNSFTRTLKIDGPKYEYKFENNTDQVRTYHVTDGNGNTIFDKVLPPGGKATGSFTGSGTGTPGAVSGPSGGDGNLSGGGTGWTLDETGGLMPSGQFDPTKVGIVPEFGGITNEPLTEIPNQGNPSTPEKEVKPLVWDSPANNDPGNEGNLKDAVYRQGTKAITDRLDALIAKPSGGGGSSNVTVNVDVAGVESRLDDIKNNGRVAEVIPDKAFDTTTDKTFTPTKAKAITALGVLPTAPTITGPSGFNGTLTVPLALPKVAAQTMSIDLTRWDAGINVFKFIVRGALSIWFFFMAVRAVKQAFA